MDQDVQHIALSGGPVEYQWFGPTVTDAQTPVVVLLHEGLGCVALWRAFPAMLAEALQVRVLAYSRYGYGSSAACALPRPTAYMHIEAQAVLPELLDTLQIGRHLLVGHSDGGSIALINAGSAARPGLMGIVTLAAHIFNEPINAVEIRKAQAAFDAGGLRDALARYHGANTDCAFRGWSQAWLSPEFQHWNLETFLPAIAVPALVMQGVNDAYGTLEQVDGIMAGLSAPASSLVLEECGHAMHRDQPERTIAAIRDFVRGLD